MCVWDVGLRAVGGLDGYRCYHIPGNTDPVIFLPVTFENMITGCAVVGVVVWGWVLLYAPLLYGSWLDLTAINSYCRITRNIAHPGDDVLTFNNITTGCAVVGGRVIRYYS